MRNKVKSILENLTLSFVSILFFCIFLEFIVFRYFFITSDIAIPESINNVVRFKPDQKGVFRVKNEIEAKFRINSSGWNSGYTDYKKTKNPDKYRVAIIGDSYISAFQVPYNKSVAEQLELKLGNTHFQVYRFGIDGAPMSQYLHMLRHEVLLYNPDLVIINLIHNDFDESYEFQSGVYTSSFMKLKIDGDMVSDEIPPKPYETPWYSWIRESATWGYFTYRQKIGLQGLRNIILGKNENNNKFQANIDVSTVDKKAKRNQIITDYILQNIKNICDSNNMNLLVVMDGNRGSIMKENAKVNQSGGKGVLKMNSMVASVAKKYNINFLDLHNIFFDDFVKNRKVFHFVNDGHWNSYSHALVATTLANYMNNSMKPLPSPSN